MLGAAYTAVELLRLSRVANQTFADYVDEVGPSGEMATASDLKSAGVFRPGSNPGARTNTLTLQFILQGLFFINTMC